MNVACGPPGMPGPVSKRDGFPEQPMASERGIETWSAPLAPVVAASLDVFENMTSSSPKELFSSAEDLTLGTVDAATTLSRVSLEHVTIPTMLGCSSETPRKIHDFLSFSYWTVI